MVSLNQLLAKLGTQHWDCSAASYFFGGKVSSLSNYWQYPQVSGKYPISYRSSLHNFEFTQFSRSVISTNSWWTKISVWDPVFFGGVTRWYKGHLTAPNLGTSWEWNLPTNLSGANRFGRVYNITPQTSTRILVHSASPSAPSMEYAKSSSHPPERGLNSTTLTGHCVVALVKMVIG